MSIEQKRFGTMPDGTAVNLYILKNSSGTHASFIDYGARVHSLFIKDKRGNFENVVLNHDTLEEYFGRDFFGAIVGRYANRIANGTFTIDNQTYHVNQNENSNTLHGGNNGFHSKVWRMKSCDNSDDAPSITFALNSPDGDEGFPGNLDVSIRYTLSTDNALILDYKAKTDQPTILNLTNHSFFNLTGSPKNSILSHELQIDADAYTEVTQELIPTGTLLPTAESPMDFRVTKTIGQDIHADDSILRFCGGYDHNFALNGAGMRKVASVSEASSGRKMLVFTDMPGLQFFSGNRFKEGAKAQGGIPLKKHHAFCLEAHFFPDAPNHPNFKSPVLYPDHLFKSTTIYKFEQI